MTEWKDGTFDLAVFLTKAGLGRRIVQLKAKETFFPRGERCRLHLLSSEGPGQTNRCLYSRKRSNRCPSRCRRLCRRGVDRDGKQARALALMAENPEMSVFALSLFLKQDGIKRSREWVRKNRCAKPSTKVD